MSGSANGKLTALIELPAGAVTVQAAPPELLSQLNVLQVTVHEPEVPEPAHLEREVSSSSPGCASAPRRQRPQPRTTPAPRPRTARRHCSGSSGSSARPLSRRARAQDLGVALTP